MLNVRIDRSRSFGLVAACALLVVFWGAHTALAQTDPNPEPTPPAREVVEAPVAATQPANLTAARPEGAQSQTGQPQTPKPGPATTEAGCGDKTAVVVPTPLPDGPQPKYVCSEPLVNADPVWKGEQIEFTFDIRNDGEGPLKILAKGG